MTFPVVWLEAHTLCWDQAQIDGVLTALGGEHTIGFDSVGDDIRGAAIVVPARYYADRAEWVNNQVNNFEWSVVFLTSDEESKFPAVKIEGERVARWVMTPRPFLPSHNNSDRVLGHGVPTGTAGLLRERTNPDLERDLDWFFSGQVNHPRRVHAKRVMAAMAGGELHATPGFTQGMDRGDYLHRLARSKAVPSPSGPATPDAFRTWEALEAGAVPIVDAACPAYINHRYWDFLLGDHPLVVVDNWDDLPRLVEDVVGDWPASGNRTWVWWQRYKRDLRRRVAADLNDMSEGAAKARFPASAEAGSPDDLITVLIPTSPIPAHPCTRMIEETVASVRYWLPDAEIVVMFDGVRPEQETRRAAYEDYQRRVLWLCQHEWGNAVPLRFDAHHHQANMTREALRHIATPLLMFVEHDAPIVMDEPIDWPAVCAALTGNRLDVVRFHHESHILDDHQHLMLDETPNVLGGLLPVYRTSQWSQRPHVARVDYYTRIIDTYFPKTCNTMIEDKMHSVCQDRAWQANRLAVYAPGPNIKRSLHTDGRGDDPKFDMRFL